MLEGVPVTLRTALHLPPCIRHRRFAVAAFWHGCPVVRQCAPHLGLRQFAPQASILKFRAIPASLGLHDAHHRLPARMDVLHSDLLLAFAAVAVEGFKQRRKGAGELVRLG